MRRKIDIAIWFLALLGIGAMLYVYDDISSRSKADIRYAEDQRIIRITRMVSRAEIYAEKNEKADYTPEDASNIKFYQDGGR